MPDCAEKRNGDLKPPFTPAERLRWEIFGTGRELRTRRRDVEMFTRDSAPAQDSRAGLSPLQLPDRDPLKITHLPVEGFCGTIVSRGPICGGNLLQGCQVLQNNRLAHKRSFRTLTQ